MNWLQALVLGLVQGLTEFLPVSSSGHLMIFRELLGVDTEGFLDFTVTVHLATVLATLVVFWSEIWMLLKGLFSFRYNDETDYVLKILVSVIPVGIVGLLFKDALEAMFSDSLFTVAIFLVITAILLYFSDQFKFRRGKKAEEPGQENKYRNGISYWQAFVVGIGQAFAVFPGLSRSGTTISFGLISGVKRSVMAQFSFLMVLIPVIGEQLLDIMDCITGDAVFGSGIGIGALLVAFLAAFVSGLFACRVMVAIVRKAKLTWFALYCLVVALAIFVMI